MSSGVAFNPKRLTFARKRRGVTKTRLATAIGVEQRSISAYESGEFNPDVDKLELISEKLNFPTEFFFGEDLDELSPDIASFRALSKMTASQRDMALGAGAIALSLNNWIESRFVLPPANVPDLKIESDPEAASETLRRIWGLGQLPIKNAIHLLESKGIRVYSLALDAHTVDAFSMWFMETPYVFLNTRKSAEHSRFDACHELGHLVLHRHGPPQGQEAEREANQFASSFLMPKSSVLANLPRHFSLDSLIELKKLWSVSVSSLVHRLHDLGVLTDWNYRSLCIQIASRGFRTREPQGIKRESSQILAKVFTSLREERFTKFDLARDIRVSPEEIEQLVFGLAVTGLSNSGGLISSSKQAKPTLSIVGGSKERT